MATFHDQGHGGLGRRTDADANAVDAEVVGLPTFAAALNFGEGTHTKRKDGSVVDNTNNVAELLDSQFEFDFV